MSRTHECRSVTAPSVVRVVVPARDEALHLDALLLSLAVAIEAVRVPVRTTLVLDSCTDRSASVAARHPWVDVHEVRLGLVGAVRRAGVARSRPDGVHPSRVWLACTDADGTVPPDWLVEHVRAAAAGVDLLLGTVRPDPIALEPRVLHAWRARHDLGEGHPHVHGANLGIRLSAYDAVGGFDPVAVHEDARLAARVQAAGLPWRATGRAPVTTSARSRGRAVGGFADYLAALA
jgi:hypothetical protein